MVTHRAGLMEKTGKTGVRKKAWVDFSQKTKLRPFGCNLRHHLNSKVLDDNKL
jgi:hypothetical protein